MQSKKMKELPLVSIIIPTYKRPENLKRAINSVLNQTYTPIEIIVVDDNGNGTKWQIYTETLLKDYIQQNKIKYITHEINRNGSAARNTGFHASQGEYINFLDDDDVFEPTKIQKQIKCLNSHTEEFGACICNSHIKGFKRSFNTNITFEGNLIQEVLTEKVAFNTSTVLFRRNVLLDLKGFDESFYRHQDWELYVRFFRKYKVCLVADSLLTKISMPNIITSNPLKAIEYKEKFLLTFKNDFLQMPKYKQIYKCQYEQLALALLIGNHKRKGIQYIRKAFTYGFPSSWVILKYLYYLLHI